LLLKGSPLLFTLFVCLLALLGLMEYYRMALADRPLFGTLFACAGSMIPLLFLYRSWQGIVAALTLLALLAASHFLFRFRDISRAAAETGLATFGLLYLPLLLGYLVLLRGEPCGLKLVFLMLFIVMSGDSAAYYLGCRFGRRKLYPAVSPNKSVEGAVGGLVGSMVGTAIAKLLFFPELGWLYGLLAALVVGAAGQAGDLFESLLKRSCGVKDSGALIPGHGGVLDRLDSILFAAPVLYLLASAAICR
jgi:phosphatidate cytidylyltransferase